MRNYNVVTKNGTEKTNKKGENSKEDMYEKENGTLIYYSTAGLIFKKRSYDFLKNTCIQYKF